MSEFISWRRAALLNDADRDGTGRLTRRLTVTLTDSAASPPASDDVSVRFRAARDVGALTDAAIRRRVPAPGSSDAETTKCTHVDFRDPDLPWRYTPEPVAGDRLRPWLALIVGPAEEVRVAGGVATIPPAILQDHRLADSWGWAHVHDPEGFSRLLSAHPPLRALTPHTAVLVPAFNDRGEDMWDATGRLNNGGEPLRALASWQFATGEGGDFETLTAQLRMPKARDLGKARLTYRANGEEVGPVDVRGALQSLQEVREETPPGQDLLARQMALEAASAGGPERLGLPVYGLPWDPDAATRPAGWAAQLRDDVRVRIHAGTGVWVGVEAQDELMRAAVEQAGSLPDAAARVARTAVAVAASGSVWARTLPAEPVERLAVLAPLATRLLTDGDASVADAVTGEDRHLDRALFTAAGQRLLGRAARVEREPVTSAGGLLEAANSGPPPDARGRDALLERWIEWGGLTGRDGEGLFHELWRALEELTWEWAAAHRRFVAELPPALQGQDPEGYEAHAQELIRVLVEEAMARPLDDYFGPLQLGCELLHLRAAALAGADRWETLLGRAIRFGEGAGLAYGPVQTAVLTCLLDCETLESHGRPTECALWAAVLRIPAPVARASIGLAALGTNLAEAVDPRGAGSPARRRLAREVDGLEIPSLARPRYPLGLDFPTWGLLKRHEPDWFLPGAESVERHTITALRTNPEFIDAYLVGLNTQFLAETRWRGLQVDRWGTPLRMFFGPVDPRTGQRSRDIVPLGDWPADSPLGDRGHQTDAGLPGAPPNAERLVLLFHTPLFRRYPGTAIYLQKTINDDELQELVLMEGPVDIQPPPGGDPTAWLAGRTHIGPVFRGDITADLVFFVFDIEPTALDEYLVVLDEPPADLRFRSDEGYEGESSAVVAKQIADHRTRVAISGAHLEAQGRMP